MYGLVTTARALAGSEQWSRQSRPSGGLTQLWIPTRLTLVGCGRNLKFPWMSPRQGQGRAHLSQSPTVHLLTPSPMRHPPIQDPNRCQTRHDYRLPHRVRHPVRRYPCLDTRLIHASHWTDSCVFLSPSNCLN